MDIYLLGWTPWDESSRFQEGPFSISIKKDVDERISFEVETISFEVKTISFVVEWINLKLAED